MLNYQRVASVLIPMLRENTLFLPGSWPVLGNRPPAASACSRRSRPGSWDIEAVPGDPPTNHSSNPFFAAILQYFIPKRGYTLGYQ